MNVFHKYCLDREVRELQGLRPHALPVPSARLKPCPDASCLWKWLSRSARVRERAAVKLLDTRELGRYRSDMAQSILIFDFGTNEEAAQQARHKIESWQQGLRLGKKVLFKFDREDTSDSAEAEAKPEETASAAGKPAKKQSAAKAKQKAADEPEKPSSTDAAGKIRLVVRLGFSDHEKLIQQRVLDRFAAEEPFKSVQGETIRQGSPNFADSEELFDSLD